MTTEYFSEAVEYLSESFDPQARTVQQIIIRAGESKNKRNYPKTVLQEAVFLFENAQTYRNHPSKADLKAGEGRRIEDLTGWLTNVRFDESRNALVGTRFFTENRAGEDSFKVAKQVIEGNAPANLFGGSINALGKGKRQQDGSLLVEAITQVVSVDDVTVPAAGGGFEKLVAGYDGGIVEAVLSEMDYQEWFDARPEYTKRLQNEMKSVRQTEAVKAVKTEADQLSEAVKDLQAQVVSLTEALEAVEAREATVRRELAVIEALHKVRGLPAETKLELRERLMEVEPEKWDGILQAKVREIKALGADKATVQNAGRQQHKDVPIRESASVVSNKPKDGEDFDSWLKRIGQKRG